MVFSRWRHGNRSATDVRAIGAVVGLAAGLSLAIEVLQLVIPGRDVDLTSVALAIFGSAVGSDAGDPPPGHGCSPLDDASALGLGPGESCWWHGTRRDSPGPIGRSSNRKWWSRSGRISEVALWKT